MKKPSRVFNVAHEDFPNQATIERSVVAAFERAEEEFMRPIMEWYINGDIFLMETASRRSQNFYLTNQITPAKATQS